MRLERREAILDACRAVFGRRGVQGATLRDILDEAGISRGTFYAHFPGMQAAFDELVERFLVELSARMAPVDVTSEVPAFEQLAGSVGQVVELFTDQPEMARLLLVHAEGQHPELDARVQQFYARVHELLLAALTTGERIGLVRPGDQPVRAWLVLGLVRQALVTYVVSPQGPPMTPAELAAVLIDTAWAGLRPT